MLKILLIEDDSETRSYIEKGLKEHGHTVDIAVDGHEGLMLAPDGGYDVLVIDRMLPKLDGISLLRALRDGGLQTPALFLTALGTLDDKVKGFASGADDYLVKPFAFAEFYARVQSLGRRAPLQSVQTELGVADLHMDLLRRSVTRGGKTIDLQPTEFRLLEYLLQHKGSVVTRTMLIEGVWNFTFDPKTNIVETHISRLRAKVDRDFDKELIKTVRGAGYIINDA